jgi:hypothetical protein
LLTRLAIAVALAVALLGPLVERSPVRAEGPGNSFFAATWERTDRPVAEVAVARTWVWGPEAFTGAAGEPYAEAPGGTRLVQYFDKARMEINTPDNPAAAPGSIWYVTNGLLARELITGQLQTGDNTFEPRGPAQVNIAGDPEDSDGPTYASFLGHLADPALEEGAPIAATLDRAGATSCCVPDGHGVTAGPYVAETGHRVASVFWDYLNTSGRIVERGRRTTGPLFANPYYATGFPLAEAYWARVRVLGVQQWVLVQPFERRVLTFTPGNAAGWQVEMGNVGRHYYVWRYGADGVPAPAPAWTLPPYPRWVPAGQQVDIPNVVARYDLHITSVDVDSGQLAAREAIRIERFNGAPPDRLFLQVVPAAYGFFTLDALSIDGMPATPAARQGGLILAFDLPPGVQAPLTITLDFRLAVGTEPSGWGGTSLDAGILRLGYWFPIVSDDHGYSDTLDPSQSRVAGFDVTLDVAPEVVVAHTGVESSRETLGDGRARYRYTADDVRDFALVLSRGFSVTTRALDSGVTLSYYSHTSSEAGVTDETLGFRQETIFAAAEDAIRQLESLIGPYPYPTYAIVDAGPSMPGGLEFPGLIYINPAYAPLDRLIYHETTHQWLYGIIGNRTLLDGWIDEGGAEFFERGLPTGFTEVPAVPAGGYAYWLDAGYQELAADGSRQWYFSIYEQGARFYYAVMNTMGRDAFWQAFRDVYARYAFAIVTPAELLATFQEHSASDLRPLFDDYFRYDWVWELLPNGG